MAYTINGVALVYGLPDFIITVAQLGQMIVQDFDHDKEDSVETIKDRSGNRASEVFPDPIDKFNLTGFVRAVAGTNTIANAKTQTLLPPIGTLVGLCFTSAEYAGITSGLTWTVKSAKQSGTNTSAVKVAIGLEYASGITAPAT